MIKGYERFNQGFVQPPRHANPATCRNINSTPHANMVITNEILHPQKNTWYPDSGTSHHVTLNSDNFQNRVTYVGQDQHHIGNDKGIEIFSIRNSVLSSQHKSFDLNILHVPAITKNLLSFRQFTLENNVFIEFHHFFA